MQTLKFMGIFLITCMVLVTTCQFSFASENLTLFWKDYRSQEAYIEVDGRRYTLDYTLITKGEKTDPFPADGYKDPELCDICWLTQDATHYDYYYYAYTCWGVSTDGTFSHVWREFLFSHENNDPECDHIDWDMGDNTCFRHRD